MYFCFVRIWVDYWFLYGITHSFTSPKADKKTNRNKDSDSSDEENKQNVVESEEENGTEEKNTIKSVNYNAETHASFICHTFL